RDFVRRAPRPTERATAARTTAVPISRRPAEGAMTKDLGKLWAERMTKSERDMSFPDSDPRDAATLMLIDRSGPTPKVLLGRRHASHKFMPGKFVFPGGRIEALDRLMPAISELHPDTEKKLLERVTAPSAGFARAFALAAVRETAEETGLLLGVKRDRP